MAVISPPVSILNTRGLSLTLSWTFYLSSWSKSLDNAPKNNDQHCYHLKHYYHHYYSPHSPTWTNKQLQSDPLFDISNIVYLLTDSVQALSDGDRICHTSSDLAFVMHPLSFLFPFPTRISRFLLTVHLFNILQCERILISNLILDHF